MATKPRHKKPFDAGPWREQLAKLTEEEFQQLVDAFHHEASLRGWGVILWTPEEIGDADVGHLEDVSIERGWDFLGTCPDDEDEDEEGEEQCNKSI